MNEGHICDKCKHINELTGTFDTTIDINGCEYAAAMRGKEMITGQKVDGFTTIDNGMGYWITNCPYYSELETVEAEPKDEVPAKMKAYIRYIIAQMVIETLKYANENNS